MPRLRENETENHGKKMRQAKHRIDDKRHKRYFSTANNF